MASRIQSPLRRGEFKLERVFKASPARVFAAWANVDFKARWFKGPGTWQLVEQSLDFRVGGKEVLHGRYGDGLETRYLATIHAIQPDESLVFTYDVHHAGTHLSVSVASVEIIPDKGGAKMLFTEQVVHLDGQDATESRMMGTAAHFDRLAVALESN